MSDRLATPKGSVTDFDFLVGRWRVHHRRLDRYLVGSTNWQEFGGESTLQKLLGGQANVDDNVLHHPSGTYRAATLRAFDPGRRAWSIWWLDGRYPTTLGSPVVGGFDGSRGTFYAEDRIDGKRVVTRFLWLSEGPDLCRWEQAASTDAGATWETNWRMRFERLA